MMAPRAAAVTMYAPAVLLGGSALLLAFPLTARVARWLLAEDHLVEDLTFAAFLAASVIAGRLAWVYRRGVPWWIAGIYVLLALAFFAIGMEELSWGQRRIGFETPEWLRRINGQGEVTLHNIGALQGSSEWMRLLAGVLGLGAIGARRRPSLDRVAAPVELRPWFLVITGHALVDVFNDLMPIEPRFDFIMQRTSEVVELEIGVAALLYTWLNMRRFSASFGANLESGA